MNKIHIILAIVSTFGLLLYFIFLWEVGGLVLISVAVIVELIVVVIGNSKKKTTEGKPGSETEGSPQNQ